MDPYGGTGYYGGASPSDKNLQSAGDPSNSPVTFPAVGATNSSQLGAQSTPYGGVGSSGGSAAGVGPPFSGPGSSSGTGANDNSANSDSEKEGCLAAHNDARAKKGLHPLQWSDELAQDAARWVQKCAKMDRTEHEQQQSRGENLSWYSGGTPSWKRVVEDWLAEEEDYDGAPVRPGGPMVKHYTQCLWSRTTHVGMASARSKSGKEYICARYWPKGNYHGQTPYWMGVCELRVMTTGLKPYLAW